MATTPLLFRESRPKRPNKLHYFRTLQGVVGMLRNPEGTEAVFDIEEGLRDLELLLGRPDARRRRAKRHFTPLDLLRKERRSSHRRRSRRYFRTAAPEAASDRGDATTGGNSG